MRRFGSTTALGDVPAPLARGVLTGVSSPAPTAMEDRRDNPGRRAWPCGQARRRGSWKETTAPSAARVQQYNPEGPAHAAAVPRGSKTAPSKRKGPQGRGQERKEGKKEGRMEGRRKKEREERAGESQGVPPHLGAWHHQGHPPPVKKEGMRGEERRGEERRGEESKGKDQTREKERERERSKNACEKKEGGKQKNNENHKNIYTQREENQNIQNKQCKGPHPPLTRRPPALPLRVARAMVTLHSHASPARAKSHLTAYRARLPHPPLTRRSPAPPLWAARAMIALHPHASPARAKSHLTAYRARSHLHRARRAPARPIRRACAAGHPQPTRIVH